MNKIVLLGILLLSSLAVSCSANPIILAPSGTTLSTGQVRAEAAFSPDNDNGRYYWLSTGFMHLELNVIRQQDRNGADHNLIGAQWAFLPETMVTPAVGFGVTDIGSQSDEGIGAYVAVTRHLSIGKVAPVIEDIGLTAGVGAAGIRGPFFGFDAKLPFKFFAQGEYDSKHFNAAVGWQPISMLRLKVYNIRSDFFFGAELVPVLF